MTQVRLLFFAAARETVGCSESVVTLTKPIPISSFLEQLYSMYPALSPYASSLRIAINGIYATHTAFVSPGDEVAIIPPVAGG